MSVIRVLHLPARTPYARKLLSPGILIVNGQPLQADGEIIPYDASFQWLDSHPRLDFFDILHIHSVEFADLKLLRRVLNLCHRLGKRVIFTAHDLRPLIEFDERKYQSKLVEVCAKADAIVCLTAASATQLETLPGGSRYRRRLSVLPHGFVVPPSHPAWGSAGAANEGTVRYAMLGALRPNRSMYATLLAWYFGLQDRDATLHILTRPIAPLELADVSSEAREVFAFLRVASDRIHFTMRPFPSDDEVISFAASADILLLPYGRGSHSGQLELAFDLNLLPVVSNVGYYREQWHESRRYVPEPIWVNWSDGAVFAYGMRLLDALLRAQTRIEAGLRPVAGDAYRQHRQREHERLLAAHAALYGGASRV